VLLNNWPIDRVKRRLDRSAYQRNETTDEHRSTQIKKHFIGAHRCSSVVPDSIAKPLVLIRTAANRQEIVAVSREAYETGIRAGMTLAEARAICSHVVHLEHEPHKDAVALEALARWMMRFSPVVAVATNGSIFLDLTGCERVFKGLSNLFNQVAAAMKRFRVSARLAVAPTPGAAWAIAYASGKSICDAAEIATALEDLPPIALRISRDTAATLHHLGIDTIGQLMRLPRDTLPARFGNELLKRLDQALGNIPEPLVPLEPFAPIQARMDFDGAVESLEAIWIVFKKLITQVVADLLRRGHGAREIEVEFYRAYAVTLCKTIYLSRPSRDPSNLFNLLRCAMETVQTDVGFLGISLIVARSQRVSDEQIQLLEHEEFVAETELSHLIERLCIRLGNEVIEQPVLVESYVPEKAWQKGSGFRVKGSGGTLSLSFLNPKPLTLNPFPEEIHAIVTPSEDRDGRPVSFTWRGKVHRLPHAVGPERIAGQWWQGHHRTRDYFDVEDEEGRRFWVFRVMETNRWYVQGEFE
jgi:protein ImuB